jgi:hypothetical protein
MLRIRRSVFLGLVLVLPALASAQKGSQNFARQFVIDSSKPYVYIKFDHIGDRKPVNDWESSKGMWLRLVNNCKLPIQISVLGSSTGDTGVLLNFEVVPEPGRFAPDEEQRKKMPYGYAADIGTLVTIPPKKDLLFSVPLESVTKLWYIQIRFDFGFPEQKGHKPAPPEARGTYQPYSLVDFSWWNTPEGIRSLQTPQP